MYKVFLTALLAMITYFTGAQVISPSNPGATSHTLTSGNATIGISSAGGGYLNMIKKDIVLS